MRSHLHRSTLKEQSSEAFPRRNARHYGYGMDLKFSTTLLANASIPLPALQNFCLIFYSVLLCWTIIIFFNLDVLLMEILVESLVSCLQYGAADAKQIRHYINFVFPCASHNNYNKTYHNPDQFIAGDKNGASDIHCRSWKG